MLRRIYALTSIAFALSMLAATNAAASAQRTFVASHGAPANTAFNCSITKPCRAFSDALGVTNDGGEVIVIDSAGYGPMTIAKSVSIIAPAGVYAGISAPGALSGVDIDGAGVSVVLHGLTINGSGGIGSGVHMKNGSALAMEDCAIANFSAGAGVWIETAALVKIAGAVFGNNYIGVLVGFGATVNVANSQVVKNTLEGIALIAMSGTNINLFIADTLVSGTGISDYCIINTTAPAAIGPVVGNISAIRVTVTGCDFGITNNPLGAGTGTLTVSNSMVTGNGTGFSNSILGTFNSLGTSQVSGNTNDISGAITTIGGK